MNVIVTIEGREAIPVRAIPLLTNWEEMSPDVVARALAGDDVWFPEFSDLQSYRIEDGSIKPIRPSYWANFTCREIEALDEQIKLVEPSHEVGYQQWRSKSLPTLPAGAFVWRNEFEKCFFMKYGDDGEDLWSERYGWVKRNPGIELDYDPFIPDADVRQTVMEGFDSIPELVPCLPGTSVPPHAPPQSASRQLRMVQMLAIQSSQEYQQMTQEVEATVLESQADADGERKNIQRLRGDEPSSAKQPVQTSTPTAAPALVQEEEANRVLASTTQDNAILNAIRTAGYDPLKLPKNSSGKPGIKADIRQKLDSVKGTPFSGGGRRFDKAWDRLKARKEIVYC